VSWDVLRCCFTPAQLCDWYDRYDCKELMNTDTKEYLQELDKTLQELPIRDSKKCTIA
jgi:hypothetical protein